MTAIWMRLRAELRARWGAWLALALIIGAFSGAALAAVAGARRADSAYDRFLVEQRAWDAMTFYAAFDPSFAELRHEDVASVPEVAEGIEAAYFEVDGELDLIASADPAFGRTFDIAKMVQGRAPDPDRADEVSVPFDVAAQHPVGSQLTMRFQTRSGAERARTFTVTGVHMMPNNFPPGSSGTIFVWGTPALVREHGAELRLFGVGFFRLEHGVASLPDFQRSVERFADGKVFFIESQAAQTEVANGSLDLLAAASWAVSGVLVAIGLLAFGQALARQTLLDSDGFPAIRALGMTGGDLLAIGLIRSALIGATAAVTAIGVSVALSVLTPIGIAKLVEPDPGLSIDAPVIFLGALLVLALCVGLSAFPAWRAEHRLSSPDGSTWRRSRIARFVFRAGGTPAMSAGVRLALERGARSRSIPVVTTIGAAAVGLGAVLMASTFAVSLDRLLGDPGLYGVRWDREIEVRTDGTRAIDSPAFALAEQVRAIDGVAAAAVMDLGVPIEIDGIGATGIGVDQANVELAPPILDGRFPESGDEIALGERTLDTIGKSIGDQVSLRILGLEPQPFTISGTVAVPGFAAGQGLGEGSVVTPDALARLIDDPPPVGTIFVRFTPGADAAALTSAFEELPDVIEVREPVTPASIDNLARVRSLPPALAGLLALFALAAIAHALLSSVRRRAREIAVLRALGFVRRQVVSTVAWQASTLVLIAIVVGVPIGMAAGRALWRLAADQLGIVFAPQLPASAIGIVAPSALALGVLIAALPARRAAATQPALVLRAE